ncbi:MAG: cation transporter [FCB group bacterium]|nr:cation transporter [FCB group bacterium]
MAHQHFDKHISGKKLFWVIVLNAIITIAEFIGGIISGYLALIADAIHNLSDVAALCLAWLGVKGAAMPVTKKSTYGYKRIEVMTALISGVSLVVISIFIFKEAYNRFLNPKPISDPWLFLTIAVIGLLGNVFSILLLQKDKGKSLNMKAAFLHMAYDALSSVAVIIGGIIILVSGLYIIDVILSTLIAVMILWSSYMVIKEAVFIFMEAVPFDIDFDEVMDTIYNIPRVKDVHDLHIWSLSSHEIALSCHICLEEKDYQQGPEIIDQINEVLLDKFHIDHGTIQLEKEGCSRSNVLCYNEHDHGKQS